MMRKWILAGILLFTAGCSQYNNVEKIYVRSYCPHFTGKLNVEFVDFNSTHVLLSKDDMKKVIRFAKSKHVFNKMIDEINEESAEKVMK